MKNTIMIAVFIMMSVSAIAQDVTTAAPNVPVLSPPAPVVIDTFSQNAIIPPASGKYLCAHCGLRREIPAKCERHQFTLVEEGLYYCVNTTCDGVTGKIAGKCTKCEKDLILMEPRKQ
ncbi:MAG: hypothetical protein V4615_12050 [Bacteroidota bacterium]